MLPPPSRPRGLDLLGEVVAIILFALLILALVFAPAFAHL